MLVLLQQELQYLNLFTINHQTTTIVLAAGRSGSAGRAQSPGRALQDIKAKLNQHVKSQQPQSVDGGDNMLKANELDDIKGLQNQPVESPPVFNSASAEIADIDQRLHALQTFLKAAKAGGPPGKVT